MTAIIILFIAAYLLFNVVITLICDQEREIKTSGKAVLLILGLPIVIIAGVVVAIDMVRGRK